MKLDSSVLRTVSIGDSIIVLFGLSSYEISVIVVIMDRAADYIGIYFSSFDVLTILLTYFKGMCGRYLYSILVSCP